MKTTQKDPDTLCLHYFHNCSKWSRIILVCGIIVVKRKITANLAVIFLKMVDLIGIEPTTLRMRTVRSPSWAIGPYYRFLPISQNKKRSFEVLSFRELRRKFSPKSWANHQWSMCVHRDANRTLSQLSYRPICDLVCQVIITEKNDL